MPPPAADSRSSDGPRSSARTAAALEALQGRQPASSIRRHLRASAGTSVALWAASSAGSPATSAGVASAERVAANAASNRPVAAARPRFTHAITASGLATLSAATMATPAAIAPNAKRSRRPVSTVTQNHTSTRASHPMNASVRTRSSESPYSEVYSSIRRTAEAIIAASSSAITAASTR